MQLLSNYNVFPLHKNSWLFSTINTTVNLELADPLCCHIVSPSSFSSFNFRPPPTNPRKHITEMSCNYSGNQTRFHLYWGGAEVTAGHAVWRHTKSQTTALSHEIRINAPNCWASLCLLMGRRGPPASLTQRLTSFGYFWSRLRRLPDVTWFVCACAVWLRRFLICREDKLCSITVDKADSYCEMWQYLLQRLITNHDNVGTPKHFLLLVRDLFDLSIYNIIVETNFKQHVKCNLLLLQGKRQKSVGIVIRLNGCRAFMVCFCAVKSHWQQFFIWKSILDIMTFQLD